MLDASPIDISDVDLANKLRDLVKDLNGWCAEAERRGMIVKIDPTWHADKFTGGSAPIMFIKIIKEL